MSCQEEQQEEIETIGELIENFAGDLVGGTYSNGSDERDYADQWFERCWFDPKAYTSESSPLLGI